MSWNTIPSRQLISVPRSHKLSATHLLASPDGSRHPLDNATDIGQFDDSFSRLAGCGSSPDDGDGEGDGGCSNSSSGGGGGGGRGAEIDIRIDVCDGGGRGDGAGSTAMWHRRRTYSRYSILDCFFACHKNIRQYIAKKKIERGLRLYEQHNQNAAVRTWSSALKSTTKRDDRFRLIGYLYRAYMDWGKYRDALEFGHRQLGISEELDSPSMRAEAYLNLARAHERLGGLERSLSYARHSLYNECGSQCRTGGLVHLTVARVYLEMGGFSRALEGFQGAHRIASNICDSSLELQVYVSLSELFGRLQDSDKSAKYASKAYDLSRSLQVGDLNSSDHRAALLRMASSLRKQGDLGDAHDYCTEATRLALISNDQATYTRSIRIMGDIYRKKMDVDRAFRQYELAMGTAAELGDRMAQMEAMDGAARCLEILRLQQRICNCRPLEFNTRLLEVAGSIGAKLLVRKIRKRLALIYLALGDEELYKTHTRLASQTELALGLHCAVCNELFGLDMDSIEALPCSHILHTRCVLEIHRRRDKTGSRVCPACSKLLNSRLNLCVGSNGVGGGCNGTSGNCVLNALKKSKSHLPTTTTATTATTTTPTTTTTKTATTTTTTTTAAKISTIDNNNLFKISASIPSTATVTTITSAVRPSPLLNCSNLSLASLSLRASSLTIDSECNITSSV